MSGLPDRVVVWISAVTVVFGTFFVYLARLGPGVFGLDLSLPVLALGLLAQVVGLGFLGWAVYRAGWDSPAFTVGVLVFVLWFVLFALLVKNRDAYLSTFGSLLSGILIAIASSGGLPVSEPEGG